MGMRIVRVGDANARFEKRAQEIFAECEELSGLVCDAIGAVGVDTKNAWSLNGFGTCRVAYVDASAYRNETVAAVAVAYRDAGYLVNTMTMEGAEDPEDAEGTSAPMVLMAIIWDPTAAESLRQVANEFPANIDFDTQETVEGAASEETGDSDLQSEAAEEAGGESGSPAGEEDGYEGGEPDVREGQQEEEGFPA